MISRGIPMGFFPILLNGNFSHGKNKKKMFVLSRRSLLSTMHIVEINLYGSIHKFNFSHML